MSISFIAGRKPFSGLPSLRVLSHHRHHPAMARVATALLGLAFIEGPMRTKDAAAVIARWAVSVIPDSGFDGFSYAAVASWM